ncbi:MAG: choice-of-anchor E domain-containing protein [Planctomycetota bacterium]
MKSFVLPNDRIEYLFTSPITGINQFDPSLGTLDSITLLAEVNLDLETSVRAFSGNGNEWTLGFTLSPILVELGHDPTGNSFNAADGESATATTSSSGPSFPGTVRSDSTQSIDMTLSGALALHPDFIGTGTIDTLEARLSYVDGALETTFVLDELANENAEVAMALSNINLTVQYNYTAVPEPSTLLCVGIGALALCPIWRAA